MAAGRRILGLFASMSLTISGAVPLHLAGELERGPSVVSMLGSLKAYFQSPPTVAAKPVPRQLDGGPLRAGPASAADTRADGGAGRKPGKGVGALPPASRPQRQVEKSTSPKIVARGAAAALAAAGNVAPQIDAQYPGTGATVPTLTPELMVTGNDPDGGPNATTYAFTVTNAAGTAVAQSGTRSSRSWTVPAGALKWGQTYTWTATASDGAAVSTSQETNALLPRFPQSLITMSLSQNGDRGFDPDTRNYTTTVTDVTVPTVGPSLAMDRFYNTLDVRRDTAFGAGWSSILDAKATEARDRAGALQGVVVTYPNGQEVGFGRNSDGSFVPPPGRFATFTAVSGGYRLIDKDGTAYVFTAAAGAGRYRIASITDVQNRALSFQYADGRTKSITAASGRRLWIDWMSTGSGRWHVRYVSTERLDPDDPETSYTHEYHYGPDDELTRVCPPHNDGKCTAYEHTSASQHPSIVANAGPDAYWRLTDTGGATATSAVLANQGLDNGGYVDVTLGRPGPLTGASATAAAFNGTSSRVELPSPLGASAGVQSLSLWFRAEPGNRGVLYGYSADPVTKSSTTGHYTPALYIGASGRLHGGLWDGSKTTIATPAAVDDGRWHQAVLVAGAGKQWLYLDGAEAGTKTGALAISALSGATRRYLGAGFNGNGWPDQPSSAAVPSFFKGELAEAAHFDRPLTADEIAALYRSGTTDSHPVIKILRPSGNATAAIDYDRADGTVSTVTDINGGVWRLGKPTTSGSSKVYRAAVLAARPADYWRFAESGTWRPVNEVIGDDAHYSDVGLGNTGGPFEDKVASFDGEASYVALGDGNVPRSGPVSVSLWFKMNAGASTGGVLYSFQSHEIWNDPDEDTDAWVPALYVGRDGKVRGQFCYCDGATPITTGGTVNDGQWHHVALAAGTGSTTLYLDGRPAGTVDRTVEATDAWNPYVGAGTTLNWPSAAADSTNGFFPGYLAEFAYYRSELSTAQVKTQFDARAKTPGPPVKTVITTDPGGKWLTDVHELDTDRKISSTDALGKTTKYGYDSGGFPRTTTDPNGAVTTEEHDVRGNVVSTTTCQDQSAGRCSTVYNTYYPDATTAQLTPDPRNDVLLTMRDGRSSSATDNRYLTTYTYDTKGNRTAVTDPLGRVTRTAYSDGTGAATGGGLVPAGLPTSITTPAGNRQTIAYYSNGDVAARTEPSGKRTSFVYDLAGRVTDETVTTSTYPQGRTTSYGYDALSRVIWKVEPKVTDRITGVAHTAATSMAYDVDGYLVEQHVQDSTGGDAGRTVFSVYNAHGQQAETVDSTGHSTFYTYDAFGNVVTETEPDGDVTRNTYDADGQLTSAVLEDFTGDPNNPSPARDVTVLTKTYDPAGRLATEADAMNWVTAYTYTDNGLNGSTTRRDPATGASFVVEQNTYDAAGNLTERKTNNGVTVTRYAVDAAGRTTSSTLEPDGVNQVTEHEYNGDDALTATNRRAGTGPVLERIGYAYDGAGNQTSEALWLTGADRAARWKLDGLTEGRAADEVGNGKLTPAGGVTFSAERGGAAVLNGADGRLTSAATPVDTTRGFTVAAWVKLGATGQTRQAVSADGLKQSPFQLRYDGPANRWQFITSQYDTASPAAVASTSTSVPSAGTWTHLTGVYDADAQMMRLYVNGSLQDTDAAARPFGSSGGVTVGAGRWNGAVTDFWSGQIDDVQLYQKALSATEVAAVRDGGGPGGDARVIRTSYRLDEDGLVLASTDPNGDTTDYTYDEAGRPTVVTAPAAMTETAGTQPVAARAATTTGYDTYGNAVAVRNAAGHVTTTRYDAANRPIATVLPTYTPPGGAAVTPQSTRAYDALGQLKTVTDALGRTTSYTYDQLGRVATETAPGNAVTRHTYDLAGDPLSITDPTGAVDTATFDYLGRKLTSTEVVRQDNANHTTRYGYNAGGWLGSVTSPAGVTTSQTYNATGQVVSSTDQAGSVTKLYYDGLGRQNVTILPNGTETGLAFDKAGRPVETYELAPDGDYLAGTFTEYDLEGKTTAQVDERGTRTTFTYDATGLLTSERQPVSATEAMQTSFGYDALGNRTRFTNGRGNAFYTTYNAMNLAESVIEPPTARYPDPADRTFTRAYDAAGQVATDRSPGGVVVGYEYDARGNLTRQTGAGAEADTTDRVFGYDAGDRMTSVSAPGGTDTFAYDDRDLLRGTTGPSGAGTFSYTPDRKLAGRTDASGTTAYTYDNAGRLRTLTNQTAGLSAAFAYNVLSQPASIAYAGGNTRTFEYDDFRRLSRDQLHTSAGTEVAAIDYGYDKKGNLTDKTTTGFGGTTENSYTYDLADQLTSWNNGVTTVRYEYDLAGNRTRIGNRTLAYDARDQLTSSSDGTQYTYTARGTLAQAVVNGTTTLTRSNAFGQAISQQAPNGGGTQTYAYDGLGRVLRTGFSYSGLGNNLATDGTTGYVRDPSDDLFGTGNGRYSYTDQHTDHVGQFTGAGTTLTGSAMFDPLGKPLRATAMSGSLGFQQEWTDSSTGRVNMHARWYNPDTGQFDSRDSVANNPVPDPVSANRFAYADNSPLLDTDTTGQWPDILKKTFKKVTKAVTSIPIVKVAVQAAKPLAQRVKNTSTYKSLASTTKNLKTKWDQGKKWMGTQAARAKQHYDQGVKRLKQQGAAAMRTATKAVTNPAAAIRDAKAFVKKHKDTLIEIAAFGGAILAGLACTAATAGTAAVACVVGSAAIINLAKDAGQGDIKNFGDMAQSLGSGAVTGLLGGPFGGQVVGKLVGPLVTKAGAGLGRTLISKAGDAALSGVEDAVNQFITTGTIDLKQVAITAATDGMIPGRSSKGKPSKGATPDTTAAPDPSRPAPPRGSDISPAKTAPEHVSKPTVNRGGEAGPRAPTGRKAQDSASDGGSCPVSFRPEPHSFAPQTRVLMADGSTKPIKNVKIGDRVRTTDPDTGLTGARVVTALHVHRDTHLTDVTVATKNGRAVLHTTQKHKIWNATTGDWQEAAQLTPGTRLHTGTTPASVVASRTFAGAQPMHDLTVADLHTYYVLAGTTSVLVHNCGGRWKLGEDYSKPNKDGVDPSMSTMRKRFWKNEAAEPDAADQYEAANISRMKRGMAPRRQREDGSWESMELSHEPIPERDGGMLLTPRWPEDHVLMDPGGHRRLPPGY
ncbi:LamG-like jellyroll fold domain-containing protein [Actinoplanes sp. NPDC048988]|uniref:LamG-like jellyroll fold domain-containing protein n=1 Tax=Actinoplanes sp. NPDC048988 TaxID=3363901 RepID=UPI00371D989A